MPKLLIYGSKTIFTISALLLLLGLNIDIALDNNFYLIGGSGIDCGMGVAGVFKPSFLISLAITDIFLVSAAFLLWRSKCISCLLLASLGSIVLLVLRFFWQQARLFVGYELTDNTNMLDALTGKCYLYYSPHDALLLIIALISMAIIGLYYHRHIRQVK